MMRELFEFAEFLAASWRLAHPLESKQDARMPTSHGILDKALYELRDKLPPQFANLLSFGNTRIGFRCYELAEILYCAQANMLTSEPNPTYLTTAVQIDDGAARRILRKRGLDLEDCRDFAQKLTEVIDQEKIPVDKVESAVA